jgi:hypothetical protein
VLKHCAANRKRWLSALPNVGPHIYNVKISGFTRSSIYIQGAAFNVTHFESRITHLLYTAINTTEHS